MAKLHEKFFRKMLGSIDETPVEEERKLPYRSSRTRMAGKRMQSVSIAVSATPM